MLIGLRCNSLPVVKTMRSSAIGIRSYITVNVFKNFCLPKAWRGRGGQQPMENIPTF